MKYSVLRATLDLWIGMFPSVSILDSQGNDESYITATGRNFMFTGKVGASDTYGDNDFQLEPQRFRGYFIIDNASKGFSPHVSPGSQNHGRYIPTRIENLAESLPFQEFIVGPNSFFVGHGHLQPAGPGYRGNHSLRDDKYIPPIKNPLTDCVCI